MSDMTVNPNPPSVRQSKLTSLHVQSLDIKEISLGYGYTVLKQNKHDVLYLLLIIQSKLTSLQVQS